VSLWVQTENIKKKKMQEPANSNPLTNIFDIDTYLNACNLNESKASAKVEQNDIEKGGYL
jgi:hypothetical protein